MNYHPWQVGYNSCQTCLRCCYKSLKDWATRYCELSVKLKRYVAMLLNKVTETCRGLMKSKIHNLPVLEILKYTENMILPSFEDLKKWMKTILRCTELKKSCWFAPRNKMAIQIICTHFYVINLIKMNCTLKSELEQNKLRTETKLSHKKAINTNELKEGELVSRWMRYLNLMTLFAIFKRSLITSFLNQQRKLKRNWTSSDYGKLEQTNTCD